MIPAKDNIPTERFPFVTLGLVLTNVVAYILAVRSGGSFFGGPDLHVVMKFGAIPYALSHGLAEHCGLVRGHELVCSQHALPGTLPAWQTAFTAMFMHASFIHIAGNMLFLWIFGNTVEDSMGHLKFLAFYIAGGLAALALQVALAPNSTAPTIGASGAIAAVLGGYILLFPRARVLTLVIIPFFVTVIEIPALVMLVVWFIGQAVFAAVDLTNPTGSGGGVAYFAHIGGFVFGLLTIKLLVRRRKELPPPVRAY
ncbi:MAG: rhomboid family intramembrane serine protease [Solirubrobacteraceae bacterium]